MYFYSAFFFFWLSSVLMRVRLFISVVFLFLSHRDLLPLSVVNAPWGLYLTYDLWDAPRIHLVHPFFLLYLSITVWLALEALGFIFPSWNLEKPFPSILLLFGKGWGTRRTILSLSFPFTAQGCDDKEQIMQLKQNILEALYPSFLILSWQKWGVL